MGCIHPRRTLLPATLIALAVALVATPAAAQFTRDDCGSFDRPLDAQDIAFRSRDGVAIRDALTAFCARATGRSRRYCALVEDLVRHLHCPFELHPAHERWPLVAAIGIHPTYPEWVVVPRALARARSVARHADLLRRPRTPVTLRLRLRILPPRKSSRSKAGMGPRAPCTSVM